MGGHSCASDVLIRVILLSSVGQRCRLQYKFHSALNQIERNLVRFGPQLELLVNLDFEGNFFQAMKKDTITKLSQPPDADDESNQHHELKYKGYSEI